MKKEVFGILLSLKRKKISQSFINSLLSNMLDIRVDYLVFIHITAKDLA